MADEVEGDRKSVASPPALLKDPEEAARKEASNGLRQFDHAGVRPAIPVALPSMPMPVGFSDHPLG
jgi:hypothetical protein